ncbi:TetR family transcriptional regulator [Histidinibacterium lentulum]|uniref:TetR family transcriptional regulator n=1 Tax=Histidinibacterium lentulum TaxID=2480588 RepID=UPI001C864B4B|nr:TetR family transcriptional regulator [Histidinibacterium lentulum]
MTDDARLEIARLEVSRHAARLFWEKGFDATSGNDIAAAAGISTRTVWRYFRSKEACVEPVLKVSELRFAVLLGEWPKTESIEQYLARSVTAFVSDEAFIRDSIAAVRILAILHREPALRSAWLMACHAAEMELRGVIADRAAQSAEDFEVRLCAASITAAMRLVDEEISAAVINDGVQVSSEEATARIISAIRGAATLPICDAVT